MLRAIRDVAGGTAIFSPAIARRMMNYFHQIRQQPAADAFPELTPRELEVLADLAASAAALGALERSAVLWGRALSYPLPPRIRVQSLLGRGLSKGA